MSRLIRSAQSGLRLVPFLLVGAGVWALHSPAAACIAIGVFAWVDVHVPDRWWGDAP